MNVKRISKEVLSDLKERGLSEDQISAMTPEDLFEEYCEWHGLVGYGNRLIVVLDELRSAEAA